MDKKINDAIQIFHNILDVMDVKAREGCDPSYTNLNLSWEGFENGNGVEIGKDIEKFIRKIKKYLSQNKNLLNESKKNTEKPS